MTMSSQRMWCKPNWGSRKPMSNRASSPSKAGLAMTAATMPISNSTNMAGIFGLVSSTKVVARAMVASTGEPTIR